MTHQTTSRCALLIVAGLSIAFSSFASHLSAYDIVYNKEQFSPQVLKQLQWLPDSHEFSYINSSQELVIYNAENLSHRLMTLSTLNLEALAFPEISWIDKTSFWFKHENKIMVRDTLGDTVIQANVLAEGADNIAVFSPQKVAYTIGANLYLSVDNQIQQLTYYHDNEHILNGHIVHRQEFGIDKGIFWSPSGRLLAYYRMDESMVDDYPFEDFATLPVTIETIKYPMAGRKSHHVKLVVYNLDTQQEVIINTGDPLDQYLTNVSWHPDEQRIFINILNREQNHIVTKAYNTYSGEYVDWAWEFRADKYINPAFPYYFATTRANRPLWCSRHEGNFKLFETNLDTHETSPASENRGDISQCLGFRENKFFFTAYDLDFPTQHGYSYDLSTGLISALTSHKKGSHNIIPSSDGQFILDVLSSPDTPYQVDLINNEASHLSTVFVSPDPLLNLAKPTIKLLRLKSSDKKYKLFGRILYPPDLDKSKKYPTIVYVYGGPHVQLIQNSWAWGARLWELMMAQKGYIVFSMDNRGSAHRGLSFEQESYCHLGICEVDDQMQGIEYLKSLDYVDLDRLGVFGWSFGGYMSASLMLKKPGIFKVAVAGGAVTDWQDYEIMYGERFMKKPIENPEGYQCTKLCNFMQNLEGDLLLISGTHDDVVVPRHTKMLSAKAIEIGKEIDTFYYPFGKHHFDKPSEVHLNNKISRYFDERLKR